MGYGLGLRLGLGLGIGLVLGLGLGLGLRLGLGLGSIRLVFPLSSTTSLEMSPEAYLKHYKHQKIVFIYDSENSIWDKKGQNL